ncbi:murein L,D-transpeptidase catalytic domain-containing protein [Lacibacter sp. H375]|uniref:murein L,D-transpeptidase catalytic domain-containing protein n=1 Tax=Lacibacter sp. H375 TaxID=3133424 RepID=UPI0030BA2EE2
MKKTIILLFCILLIIIITIYLFNTVYNKSSPATTNKELKKESPENITGKALHAKAVAARQFVKTSNYNQRICFLIDMKIRSGAKRFFVYDLKNNSVLQSGVVTHGRCNERWLIGRKYGNEPGCGCTSLGKYKIGNAYMGRFGLAYKLHGLDSTNNNAFKRFVVLHAHDCVPENEVWSDICQSDGCPTVSPGFLDDLKAMINESKKPILLWIYESK